MAGDTVLGSMYWNLGLRGTLTQDVSSAKSEINGLDAATRKADGTFSIFEGVTSRNAREIRVMGAGVAAIGGALTLAGMEARNAGGDFETLGSMASTAGIAMTVLGGAATSIAQVMKAMAVAMNSELVASIKNFVSVAPAKVAALEADTVATIDATAATVALSEAEIALNPSIVAAASGMEGAATAGKTLAGTNIYATTMTEALAAAGYSVNPSMIAMAEGEKTATAATLGLAASLRILGAATVIGAVVTGVYLLYEGFNASTKAGKELEDEVKRLNDKSDQLRFLQSAVNEQLKIAEQRYDSLTDKVQAYNDLIAEVNSGRSRALEIDDEIARANLAAEGAALDAAEAREALAKATDKSTEANKMWTKYLPKQEEETSENDRKRAEYNARVADQRAREAQELVTALEMEKSRLPTEEQLKALATNQAKAAEDRVRAEEDLLRIKQEEEAIANQIRTYDLAVKLMDWQEKGLAITQDMRNKWSKVPWMQAAMDLIPQDVWRYPDVKGTLGLATSTMAVPGQQGIGMGLAAQYIYAGGLSSKQIKNPVYGTTLPPEEYDARLAVMMALPRSSYQNPTTIDNSFTIEHIEVKNGQTTAQVLSDANSLQAQRARRGYR
jgi:hypothetical protein